MINCCKKLIDLYIELLLTMFSSARFIKSILDI